MSPERHAMAGNHARVTTAAFSHQCKGIREIFACEIRNPEEKIPEEYGIFGFGIRNPTNDWNAKKQRIRNSLTAVRNQCLGTYLLEAIKKHGDMFMLEDNTCMLRKIVSEK